MTTPAPLFEELVRASRLNRMLAPFTITRLLVRANVAPATVTPTDVARALPTLEEGLRVYLSDDDLRAAMADIRALAA